MPANNNSGDSADEPRNSHLAYKDSPFIVHWGDVSRIPRCVRTLCRVSSPPSRHQPETSLSVEDLNHPRPSLQFLIEPLRAVGGADAPAVRLREGQASEALLDVVGHLRMAPAPPICQLAGEPERRPLLGVANTPRARIPQGGRALFLPTHLRAQAQGTPARNVAGADRIA